MLASTSTGQKHFPFKNFMAYTQAMKRLSTSILLILCLSWQALAYAGYSIGLEQEDGPGHTELHFFSKAHHHSGHDDGEAHQDESRDSLSHLSEDDALFSPALAIDPQGGVLPTQSMQLLQAQDSDIPTRYPGGLDRPPKIRS